MGLAIFEVNHNPTKIAAALMRKSFKVFARRAWEHIDPTPVIWNWHVEAVCDALQWVTEGRIKDLLINIPPGHAKSTIASVLWPAWNWARTPSWQLIVGSYEAKLPTRDAVKARDLMRSKWWLDHFNPRQAWKMVEDQNEKTYYANTAGGHRASVGVGGKGTGYRCRCLLIDDPLKASDAHSMPAREEAKRWIKETMASRFNDPRVRQRAMIMQRLHEDDPAGDVLQLGGWQHLNLPSEFEPSERSILYDVNGVELWRDPRTHAGELLFPQLYNAQAIADAKSPKLGMGSIAYSAQHGQKPVPAAGGLLKRAWFDRRWLRPGQSPIAGKECRDLPIGKFDTWEIVTDAAFKNTETSDLVAIGVFARAGPDLFMIDLAWDRMGIIETMGHIRRLREKYRKVTGIVIEDKANGSAIIEMLKQELSGVIPIEPEGGKESRIVAASNAFEAGNFWLPATSEFTERFIAEAAAFPLGKHDDAIDMVAYAVNRLIVSSDVAFLERLVKG